MKNLTVATEMKRRTDLVMNESVRFEFAKIAQSLGITVKEWEENKAIICMYFANEICAIENRLN